MMPGVRWYVSLCDELLPARELYTVYREGRCVGNHSTHQTLHCIPVPSGTRL